MGRWYLRQLETAEPAAACVATWGTGAASGEPDAFAPQGAAVVVYEHPELPRLRVLVDAARARLAELETAYTIDKARVDSLQAGLFQRLRTWHQERDRLRLVVNYRQQFLEVLLRQGEEEAEQVERQYRQAKTRSEQECEETAQTLAARRELTAEEQGELRKLWKKLVSLYHPDRFAHEPDKLATYEKLTAAINHAKDRGDLETLRQIAGDPHGFILRQGWASLDFREEEQVARLRQLWESLELEILRVLEAGNRLRESADFELYGLTAKQPEMLDSVVAKQTALLEKEINSLASEAERLGREIGELTGKGGSEI